jgi:hypothetical protein
MYRFILKSARKTLDLESTPGVRLSFEAIYKKIVEISEIFGFSAVSLAQKESVGGKHKIPRHGVNIRRDLCKMEKRFKR